MWPNDLVHLHDSIQRDAIRTDPTESFIDDSYIQKLINIVMIYTLEHKRSVKYTQVCNGNKKLIN